MMPKIRQTAVLGLLRLGYSPLTALLAFGGSGLDLLAGGLCLLLDGVDNTGVDQLLGHRVHVGRRAFQRAVHGVGGVADLVRKPGQVFDDDPVTGVGDHRGGLVQGLVQPRGGALDGVVDLRRQLGQAVLDDAGLPWRRRRPGCGPPT